MTGTFLLWLTKLYANKCEVDSAKLTLFLLVDIRKGVFCIDYKMLEMQS